MVDFPHHDNHFLDHQGAADGYHIPFLGFQVLGHSEDLSQMNSTKRMRNGTSRLLLGDAKVIVMMRQFPIFLPFSTPHLFKKPLIVTEKRSNIIKFGMFLRCHKVKLSFPIFVIARHFVWSGWGGKLRFWNTLSFISFKATLPPRKAQHLSRLNYF